VIKESSALVALSVVIIDGAHYDIGESVAVYVSR